MKLLIITSKPKLSHLEEFGKSLKKFNVEYKLIEDLQYIDKFSILTKHEKMKKFEKLIGEFVPDWVLLDRISELGLKIIEKNIPLLVTIRGDIWEEEKIAKEGNSLRFRLALIRKRRIIKKCISKAEVILPISDYLSGIVKKQFPKNRIIVFPISSREPNYWKNENGKKLKHPCVGIVQGTAIWGKTKEMLILPKIIEAHTSVNFYWAGDGEFTKLITSKLERYDNFTWLGRLSYPDEVKKFVSEIDVFALVSGMDSFGQVILEASLLKKPVLASNVGGISDIVKHGKTGFLIEKGDVNGWIDKISLLINDQKRCKEMGEQGREFIKNNFSWEKTAEKFINILKEVGTKTN